jgi:hypothetical protein
MKPVHLAVAFAIVVAAVAGTSVFVVRSCARIPLGEAERALALGDEAAHKAVDLAKRIVDGLERRLQLRPEIRIDRETEVTVDRALLQLATVTREFTHEFRWRHEWAGSTKSLRLRGRFAASAGFDLGESFHLDIDSRDLSVNLSLPPPRVLSCELIDYTAEEDEGWWNRITPEERHRAVNAMIAGARRSMEGNEELRREARRTLETQMAEVITESGGRPGLSNGAPFAPAPPR